MEYIDQLEPDLRQPHPDPESMRLAAIGIEYAILPELQRGQRRDRIDPTNPFGDLIRAGRIRHEYEIQRYEHFLTQLECALLWGTFKRLHSDS